MFCFRGHKKQRSLKQMFYFRGHKHFSELAYSKRSVLKKMCATEHDTILSQTANFLEQSCTYLVEILHLTLTTEFCASLMDNSTTCGTLELGTFHGNQHFPLVPC